MVALTIDVGTLSIIVLTVTASCCMGYFLARIIWAAYEGRSKSPDYIYCGKCHQLVGQSSTVAPHQVGYPGPYMQGNTPGGLVPPSNNSQPIALSSQNDFHQDNMYSNLAGSQQFQGPSINLQPPEVPHQQMNQHTYQSQGTINVLPDGQAQLKGAGCATISHGQNESAVFQRLGINRAVSEEKLFEIDAKELESAAFSPAQTWAPPNSLLNSSGVEVLSPRQQPMNLQIVGPIDIQQTPGLFHPNQTQPLLQTKPPTQMVNQHTNTSHKKIENSHLTLSRMHYTASNLQTGALPRNLACQDDEEPHNQIIDMDKDSVFNDSKEAHNSYELENHCELIYDENKNNQVRVLRSPSHGRATPVSKTPGNASGKRPLRQSVKSRRSLKDFLPRKSSRKSSKKSSLGINDQEAESLEPLLNGESDEQLEQDDHDNLQIYPIPQQRDVALIRSSSMGQRKNRNPGSPGNTATAAACLKSIVLARDIPVNSRGSNERVSFGVSSANEKQHSGKKLRKTASGRSKGSQLMAVRAGYVDSEVTSQSEDERGINYVVRGPLNYNEFQDSPRFPKGDASLQKGGEGRQSQPNERQTYFSEDRHIETRSTNNNSYQYGLENPRQEHLRHQQGHGHRREKELSYTRGDPQMQPCYGNEVVKDTGYKNNNFHKYGSKTVSGEMRLASGQAIEPRLGASGSSQVIEDGFGNPSSSQQQENQNNNSSKRSYLGGQNITDISELDLPPLSPTKSESSHPPHSTDISRVQSTSLRMQSTTPPQSHGNHYKHGHHQLFVQSPEQNKMNVESAAERGRRPDIQCTAATPNRNNILRKREMESCSSQVTIRPASSSPIQSSPEANEIKYVYKVNSMHRHASLTTTGSSRHNSVTSVPDELIRNVSGPVNPGLISSPQVLGDPVVNYSLPVFSESLYKSKNLIQQPHRTIEGDACLRRMTRSQREKEMQRAHPGIFQDHPELRTPRSVDRTGFRYDGTEKKHPFLSAERSPPMKHPPPDLLTNPKFDRNKEIEFQGLHKVPHPNCTPRGRRTPTEFDNSAVNFSRSAPLRSSSPLDFNEEFQEHQDTQEETKRKRSMKKEIVGAQMESNLRLSHYNENRPKESHNQKEKDVKDVNIHDSESTNEAVSISDGKYTTDGEEKASIIKATTERSLTSKDNKTQGKPRRRDTESSQATSMEWDHGGEDLRGVSDDYTLFSENEEIEVTARRYGVNPESGPGLQSGKVTPHVEPPQLHSSQDGFQSISSRQEYFQVVQSTSKPSFRISSHSSLSSAENVAATESTVVADNDAEDNALLDDKGEDVQSMDALIDLSVDKIVDKNGNESKAEEIEFPQALRTESNGARYHQPSALEE